MTRQMMEEICLYRLCERDVSADNGVALDGWGTSPSPDDGDRLLSPKKEESAFFKRSRKVKKTVSSTTATTTKLWCGQAATSTKSA